MERPQTTYPESTAYWLWLVMVYGVASARILPAVEQFSGPQELFYALHDPDCTLIEDRERRRIAQTSLQQAKDVMAFCEKNGIGIITWESEIYPTLLRQIYAPPTVLFYKGRPEVLARGMTLGVVGTRRPSDYSRKTGEWLCRDLARCGLVIVSGCALGLDAVAHKAAVDEGKPTIAVLGCGVDYDYPRENRALKAEIVKDGLLLSEYFPGSQPYPSNFPTRNRILSGLSESVLVLEAGAKSGSIITANIACEQGRQVFCVPPHDLFDKRYSGVYNFLRDGAYPVFNYTDVLYNYYLKYPHKLAAFDSADDSRSQDSLLFAEETPKPARRKSPVKRKRRTDAAASPKADAPADPAPPKTSKTSDSPAIPAEADADQRRVLERLAKSECTVNGLCVELGFRFEQISVLIMEMEMLGWIVNTGRDRYALSQEM